MERGTTKEVIKYILLRHGISKYRLARNLNIAPIMIDNYLNITRMGVRNAAKVKDIYDIEITDVYDPVSHVDDT